jgi:hypothetical protein
MGGKGIAPSFLTLALDESEWSAPCPGTLPPRESATDTHCWMGGWVGPRASLDDVGNRKMLTLLGTESQLSSP